MKPFAVGYRVITWFGGGDIPVFLLSVCQGTEGKSVEEGAQCACKTDGDAEGEPGWRCEEVEEAVMSKKAFDKIATGLADAIAIAKGEADPAAYRVHVPADIDVLRIRRNMGLTREAFAMRFGLRLGTVRDWEQRKRRPEGAARVLLTVIEKEPEAVARALAAAAA
jgi:putative transcriptional regulator